MRTWLRVLGLTAALLALVLLASPAGAITFGQPDGNRHPNVGGLVVPFDDGNFLICSGTLISPTVFLTAAHCDVGIRRVFVSFDPSFSSSSPLLAGTMHANPNFNHAQSDPQDIAVVVLDRPVTGIVPASLPAAGQLDRMKADHTLNQSTRFTAVGYGGQEQLHAPGTGKPVRGFLDTREFATSSYNSLNNGYLRLSQNNAHDDGGTCFGDSGGPNLLGTSSTIAAITITGDSVCKATNVDYRLNIPTARAFLSAFVQLP
jgi:hypothetical protein